MAAILLLIFYAAGVYLAYTTILKGAEGSIMYPKDYHNLFLLSQLSWVALILYGITRLLNDTEEN